MNGVCDWVGCNAQSQLGYSVDPARPREMCWRHWEEFVRLEKEAGKVVARRKLDAKRRRLGVPEDNELHNR
jgi:hypothetical protein